MTSERTGAERYFDARLDDPDYRAAYERARREAVTPPGPEADAPSDEDDA